MKFFLLNPEHVPCNPVLFPTFIQVFESNGHEFVSKIEDCDCVLMDLHSRINDYAQNDIDWILAKDIKVATFDEWDRGNMSTDVWPNPLTQQQELVMNNILKRSIHFCRLMDTSHIYRYPMFPYEKPISYKEPMITPDELFNREYDVVFIANQSPSRDRIAEALRNDGRLNCNISIGAKKIEFSDFLKEHKKGKLFVSSGAGGMSNERKQCLFSISGIIEERTQQVLLHELTNLENCVMIDNPPSKLDLDSIYNIVNNKDALYKIYTQGYDFMKRYYSVEYIATNILNTIINNLL